MKTTVGNNFKRQKTKKRGTWDHKKPTSKQNITRSIYIQFNN